MLEEYEVKNIISIDDGWRTAGEIEKKIEKAGLDSNITVKDFCETYEIEVDEEEAETYNGCRDISLKGIQAIENIAPKMFSAICETLEVDIDASLKTLKSILS